MARRNSDSVGSSMHLSSGIRTGPRAESDIYDYLVIRNAMPNEAVSN